MGAHRATVLLELDLRVVDGDQPDTTGMLEWWLLDQLNADMPEDDPGRKLATVTVDDVTEPTGHCVYEVHVVGHHVYKPEGASSDLRNQLAPGELQPTLADLGIHLPE